MMPRKPTKNRSVAVLVLAMTLGVLAGANGASNGSPAVLAGALAAPVGAPAAAPTPVVPQAFLPVLSFQAGDDVCRTWISAQNIGTAPNRVLFVALGTATECGDNCRGPLAVECSGLIHPGGAWHFLGAQIPTGSLAGVLFSITGRTLAAIGADPDQDQGTADYLCDYLSTYRNCSDYASFKAATDWGTQFQTVSMAQAAGGPIAATVLRNSPGVRTPGVEVGSTYEAVLSANGLARSEAVGGYVSYVAPVHAQAPELHTALYIQNAGSECATVDVWFKSAADCADERLCRTLSIAPGATVQLPAADCVGTEWLGSAWVKSDQPVAVVADTYGGDALTTYAGVAGIPVADAAGAAALPGNGTVAYAPLFYSEGWVGYIVVQNLDHVRAGRFRVTGWQPGGASVGTQEIDLCPHGVAYAYPGTPSQPPGDSPGYVWVESVPVGGQAPVPISAVARLSQPDRASRDGQLLEAAAYSLIPDSLALIAGPGSGLGAGVGVVAVPNFTKDLYGTGVTAELAIRNLVRSAGETDVAVLLYDENDLVKVLCRTLPPGAGAYIDLWNAAPELAPGFMGSAVVSATAWTHADPGTGAPRVGLAAAGLLRTGTSRGDDIPGDELSLFAGTPLRVAPRGAGAVVGECPVAPAPWVPRPAPALNPADGTVWLPVLSDQGQEDVCRATVTVTNAGGAPAKALAVLFGEPGFCGPQCQAAVDVQCSGLLAPGGTWQFLPNQALGSQFSAVVYGFNTRTLANQGHSAGGDQLVVDFVCQTGRINSDCARFRQFQLAYATGGEFQGVSLAGTFAAPMHAVVRRECPDPAIPTAANTSTYDGLSGAPFDLTRPSPGGYWTSTAAVLADVNDLSSTLYLQNTGLACASVAISFAAVGEAAPSRSCTVFYLSPGEAYQFAATDCLRPGFAGAAYIHSTEPLAVVGETLGASIQRTWPVYAAADPYDLDDDGAASAADITVLDRALGSSPGAPTWNPRADYDHDLTITDADQVFLRLAIEGRPAPTATPGTARQVEVYLPWANKQR
jgi:hypothetical protein